MSFDGLDLYPSLLEKVAALTFSLVGNHPFVDGNKRIGHAVMETTLALNGIGLDAPVEEQESLFLGLAAGVVTRSELLEWLRNRTTDA
jgi:death-on-curing protein